MSKNSLKDDKELHYIEYIGCNIETLKEHLEKQLEDKMSLENNEELELESTIKRLHYTNLQPLWASENIAKGNRYIGKKS